MLGSNLRRKYIFARFTILTNLMLKVIRMKLSYINLDELSCFAQALLPCLRFLFERMAFRIRETYT
jgi:hypothetical protein